jgi:hypothetical protein
MTDGFSSDARISFLQDVTGADLQAVHSLVAGTIIRIVFDSSAVSTLSGQVLGYQLATLTARLFDRVELEGEESAVSHPSLAILSGPFLAGLRNTLPLLRDQGIAAESSGLTITVGIGADAGPADVWLGCSSWSTRFSSLVPQGVDDTKVTLGALAAGVIGASEIFKLVFKGHLKGSVSVPAYTLSLLDYGLSEGAEPELPERIELDATLFGCGSIGCGFLLGTLLSPQISGVLNLVDNGRFDAKNPVKYQLLDYDTGKSALLKAPWARQKIEQMASNRLVAREYVGTAESYVASLPVDYSIPVAISAVDTRESRVEIQETLPCMIVNAGIEGTSVEVSVHGFGHGPCLACLQLQAEMESWNAGPIAVAVGLSPERAYNLIRLNEGMTREDINLIKAKGILPHEKVEEFLDQPLLSLWQRAAYSQAQVQVGEMSNAQVTTAFVSAFAGVLLTAELIKAVVPELREFRVNAYQQNLLGVPAEGKFKHERDLTGQCLCHSSFRLAVYQEKYHDSRL